MAKLSRRFVLGERYTCDFSQIILVALFSQSFDRRRPIDLSVNVSGLMSVMSDKNRELRVMIDLFVSLAMKIGPLRM